MAEETSPDTKQSRAKVFISYSRKNIAFADRLDAALKARGFEPLIDRTDIYAFEKWWERIEALIRRADTVVFVISPDAVASDVALKEIAEAESLNKRFAPVVWRRVDDKLIPEPLAKLNFIFFDDETQFEQRADQLAELCAPTSAGSGSTPTLVSRRGAGIRRSSRGLNEAGLQDSKSVIRKLDADTGSIGAPIDMKPLAVCRSFPEPASGWAAH